jgi:2-phospho-L-lactate guanylyltransferase (CobY/MobA/RfbA family)
MKVYIATNYRTLNPVRQALDKIAAKLNLEISQTDYYNIEEKVVPQIIETIKNADVVIADISNSELNIYYEVGISHSFGLNSSRVHFNLGDSFYFSTITFTTLGYRNIIPLGGLRALASIEAFLGLINMGYLIAGYSNNTY